MKTTRTLACLLMLLTTPAFASERTDSFQAMIADAPADALGVIYVHQPADLLNHAILRRLLEMDDAPAYVADARSAIVKLLDGPLAIVVTGSPMRPDLLKVTLTARVSMDSTAFFKALDGEFIAALNRAEVLAAENAIGFERSGDKAIVRLPGPMPIHLTLAIRDGMLRASTSAAAVDDWLASSPANAADSPPSFAESDDYARLLPYPNAKPDLLCFVNLRQLMPLASLSLQREPEVAALFNVEQFEAVGLTAEWSGMHPRADLTVCLKDAPAGLAKLAMSSGRPVRAATVLPPDTVLVAGGTFASAAEVLERIGELTDLLDPAIADEYGEEQLDFLCDFGFDIHNDLLANMVDEAVVAVRPNATGLPEMMLAVRLNDPAVFEQQHGALASAFELRFEASTYRDVTIFEPENARLNMAYGVVDHYLVVAPEPAAIRSVIDAWHDGKTLAQTPAYRGSSDGLSGGPAAFAYVAVARLAGLALERGEISVDPSLGMDEATVEAIKRVAKSRAAATLTLSSAPGTIRLSLDFAGGELGRDAAGEVIWSSIAASLARSRELARRGLSAANLREVVQASLIHTQQHQGEWPNSLGVLVTSGNIQLQALGNVYAGTAPRTIADADRESYYLLRANIPKDVAPTEVIAAEREIRRGEGANFAYADGHVAFVAEPEAGRMLAILRSQACNK